MRFSEDRMFSYNERKKLLLGLSLISVVAAAALVSLYLFLYRDLIDLGILKTIVHHVVFQVQESTILGLFYATMIGGLFFLSIPLELLFVRFLNAGYSSVTLISCYLIGLAFSFGMNYLIGARFSYISMRIISPKRFYRIKGLINKHGVLTIYILNVLPFISQPLSALLGVFRYNKTRFYVFFLLGQLTKYVIIALAV